MSEEIQSSPTHQQADIVNFSISAEDILEEAQNIANDLKSQRQTERTDEEQVFFDGLQLFNRKSTSVRFLVEKLVPAIGLTLMSGPSDVGKSTFLRQLAVGIVTGDSKFCGFPIEPKHRRVLFISSEDDPDSVSVSLKRLSEKSEGLANLKFCFASTSVVETLELALEKEPIDLLVIDCILDFFGGRNMNLANEARTWFHPIKALAVKHSFAVIGLTHNSKRSEERTPNKANLLGSQSFEAAPRAVFELRLGDTAEARWLSILKANFLPDADKSQAYELSFKEQRFDTTGNRKPLDQIFKSGGQLPDLALIKSAQSLDKSGLTQREVAEKLKISVGKVNKLLKRAVHVHDTLGA